MKRINVLGFDPSLRNWGVACGTYTVASKKLAIKSVDVLQPVSTTKKTVRQNSKDLVFATYLAKQSLLLARNAQAIFIEVPHGSQSARSMASYGICIGVIAALVAEGLPVYEMTELEVKTGSIGKKKPTKADMLKWASTQYPQANWPYKTIKSKKTLVAGKAEHMADAVAACHAGIRSEAFIKTLSLFPQ